MLSVFETAQAIATIVLLSLVVYSCYRMLAASGDDEFLCWRTRMWKLAIITAITFCIFAVLALLILPV